MFPKTIYYISTLRLPTEKAYGINMVKTCEALTEAGAEVRLIVPAFRSFHWHPGRDIYAFYGIQRSFAITFFPFTDIVSYLLSFGIYWRDRGLFARAIFSPWLFRLAFLFDQLVFALVLWAVFLFRSRRSIVYTRSAVAGLGLKTSGFRVYHDLHGFPYRLQWFWRRVFRQFDGLTVTNRWKAERCERLFGIGREKILVAPNGFDSGAYQKPINRFLVRQGLVPDPAQAIALYTGHLYDWKGAHIFAEAAKLLPGVQCVFIGGTEEDQQRFRDLYRAPNIIVLGRRPHNEIASYLRSADVLVHPNPGLSREKRLTHFAVYDTSPIKLFEYMASGVPIVATDLPSTREILNAENSTLVIPNNAEALVEGINQVLKHHQVVMKKAEQALVDVERYSWSARSRNILAFMARI